MQILEPILTAQCLLMKDIIDEFTKRGIRDNYIFMIGGEHLWTILMMQKIV